MMHGYCLLLLLAPARRVRSFCMGSIQSSLQLVKCSSTWVDVGGGAALSTSVRILEPGMVRQGRRFPLDCPCWIVVGGI